MTTSSIQHPRSRIAFTLIELLVVVTIIGVLAGLVLGVSKYATTKGDRARAVADLERIKAALEEHRAVYGTYPVCVTPSNSTSWLQQLWDKPIADGHGPFIKMKSVSAATIGTNRMIDPWGNDYRYLHRLTQPFATFNNSKYGYDLWSAGPDGASDADDITNWRGDI